MRKWTIAMVATVSLFVGIFISDKAVQASGITTPIRAKAVAMAAAAYPSDCNSGSVICYYDQGAAGGFLLKSATSTYAKSACYTAYSQIQVANYISNPSASAFVVYLNTSCSGISAPIYAHSSGAMNSQWSKKIRSIVKIS